MSRKSFSPIALSALALAVLAAPLQGQAERVSVTGERVGIWNIIGKVTVTPGSGRAVQVAVTRRGKDAAKLGIEHGTIRGRETVRIIYPATGSSTSAPTGTPGGAPTSASATTGPSATGTGTTATPMAAES